MLLSCFRHACFVLLVVLCCPANARDYVCGPTHGLHARHTPDGVSLMDADMPVMFYQMRSKSTPEGTHKRGHYFHPLYGLDGEVLTEDFPEDHLHHRGIFSAWHQLSVGGASLGDPWILRDVQYDVRQVETRVAPAESVTLTARSHLLASAAAAVGRRPVVEETYTACVHAVSEGLRVIDLMTETRALMADVRIGGSEDDKGYGGFSVRLRLPDDVKLKTIAGFVIPQRIAMDVGEWVDITASYRGAGSRPSGVVVLIHPLTPGHPRKWILRSERSMQNHAYPGREAIALSQREPLVMQYRLIVHRGELDADAIRRQMQEMRHDQSMIRRATGTRP